MACVQIVRQWPDGDMVMVTVKVNHAYPDELAEAKATAVSAFAEAFDLVIDHLPEVES